MPDETKIIIDPENLSKICWGHRTSDFTSIARTFGITRNSISWNAKWYDRFEFTSLGGRDVEELPSEMEIGNIIVFFIHDGKIGNGKIGRHIVEGNGVVSSRDRSDEFISDVDIKYSYEKTYRSFKVGSAMRVIKEDGTVYCFGTIDRIVIIPPAFPSALPYLP